MRKIILNLVVALALVFMTSFVFADSSFSGVRNLIPCTIWEILSILPQLLAVTTFSANLICNNVVQNVQFPTFNNLLLTNFMFHFNL